MRAVFHPFLPNGPSGDPVVWIDVPDEGHSLLLDLGDLRRIPHRKLLRVDRAVVTHAHMDHFIGFDHLLRLRLGHEQPLVVTGPPGFLRHVQGKIDAYDWNLIGSYPVRLVAEELDGETIRSIAWTGAGGMRPEPLADRAYSGTLHAHRAYTMHVGLLDHGLSILGVGLRETEHLSVNKDRMQREGLKPGAWLAELKNAVRRKRPGDESIEADTLEGGTRRVRRDEIAQRILFRTPGQRIAYFTDLAYHSRNRDAVAALADGVDLLICECAFLHADEALARERNHLTARQAGELARAVGAQKLAPFHFSPRYQGREEELLAEAQEAFRGSVVRLAEGPVYGENGML